MPNYRRARSVTSLLFTAFACITLSGCGQSGFRTDSNTTVTVSSVPAVRLNFRYEADVPAPAAENTGISDEKDAGVQADFDATRTFELLDRTLVSPDKKRVLAVYHHISDVPSEFRLDMYTSDGKLLRKLTSDTMAVHFPDTIVWSPDSSSLAFVAMIRASRPETALSQPSPTPVTGDVIDATEGQTTETPAAASQPTPPAPTGIMTFRTEQIYLCSADGTGVKPVTETEGLIYFYYAWSPDGSMLAALAATAREWKYLDITAGSKGEVMIPQGRLRIIEKNGRERRLDDNLTAVRPVWSPDSSKVATAFETQIRVYDAVGTNPTQAAIPLRNQLLISSQAYDRDQQRQLSTGDAGNDAATSATPSAEQPLSTLPDEKLLVSYNPIVEIAWTAEDLLYLKTAYIRRMQNAAENVVSFSRWHRLVFTPQAPQPTR